MRAIIQRVTNASVTVEGQIASRIGRGYCVLLGVFDTDTKDDAAYVLKKLLNLRLFADETNPKKTWAKSVVDIDGEILMVSQFTLCHVLKGNKPDFHKAMTGASAKVMFDDFIADMGKLYKPEKIQTGVFGAMMSVGIENDGPVTIVVDSREDGSNGSASASASNVSSPVSVASPTASPKFNNKNAKQQEQKPKQEESPAAQNETTSQQ